MTIKMIVTVIAYLSKLKTLWTDVQWQWQASSRDHDNQDASCEWHEYGRKADCSDCLGIGHQYTRTAAAKEGVSSLFGVECNQAVQCLPVQNAHALSESLGSLVKTCLPQTEWMMAQTQNPGIGAIPNGQHESNWWSDWWSERSRWTVSRWSGRAGWTCHANEVVPSHCRHTTQNY